MGLTKETLEMLKGLGSEDFMMLRKAGWLTTTGLVNYDLEPIARMIFPNPTPFRNTLPRKPGNGDTAHRWKAIIALPDDTGDYAFTSEGHGNETSAPTVINDFALYATIMRETSVSMDAEEAATSFDDARRKSSIILLQQVFRDEEKSIVGSNYNWPLGRPVTPTVTLSTGGGMGSIELSVIVVPLTMEGLKNSSVTAVAGVPQQVSRTNRDGSTDRFNAGSGRKSVAGTLSISGGSTNSADVSTTPVAGAAAYAWYWGTAGNETLGAITSIAKYKILTTATGTQVASDLADADYSYNDGTTQGSTIPGFNGLVYQAAKWATNNAYYAALANGSTLTSDGEGGIVEFSNLFKDRYDNYRLGPSDIWMSSDVALSFRNLCVANGSSTPVPLMRINVENGGVANIIAGANLPQLFNMYTGETIKTHVHPYLPAGMALATTEVLPYTIDEEPTPLAIRYAAPTGNYRMIEWPLRTTAYESAVRVREVLENKFPPALGLIQNISV